MDIFAKSIIFLAGVAFSNAAKVTFYEHSNWQGRSISFDYEGLNCYNLPDHFNDQTSSISTHDNCFLVFEHGNCQGRSERVAPGTRSHGHLADVDFNDKISSFRQCSPSENTCRRPIIEVDTSETPDLHNFGQRLKSTLEEWYPFTCRLLYSPNHQEIDKIHVKIDPNMDGVAGADAFGNRISGAAKHYRNHPDDLGSMIHEMAHLLQKYRSPCDWITEGVADYPRRVYYERDGPERPNPNSRYPDPVVYFLKWVEDRYPNTLYYVNNDCRGGSYKEDLWQRLTGSTPRELHERMRRES